MANEVHEAVLNGVLGRQIVAWKMHDDGMHFDLDDGRVIVLSGVFALAVFIPNPIVH